MIDPFLFRPCQQPDQSQVIRGKRKMAVTGSVRSLQAFKKRRIVIGEQGLLEGIPCDLKVNSIVNMKRLVDERQRHQQYKADHHDSSLQLFVTADSRRVPMLQCFPSGKRKNGRLLVIPGKLKSMKGLQVYPFQHPNDRNLGHKRKKSPLQPYLQQGVVAGIEEHHKRLCPVVTESLKRPALKEAADRINLAYESTLLRGQERIVDLSKVKATPALQSVRKIGAVDQPGLIVERGAGIRGVDGYRGNTGVGIVIDELEHEVHCLERLVAVFVGEACHKPVFNVDIGSRQKPIDFPHLIQRVPLHYLFQPLL